MFQVSLGYMMREEQFKDYVREVDEDRRKAKERQSRRTSRLARAVATAPLALVLLIARAIIFRHSL
ncbi:MAG: hypothetical protein HZB51_32040 [Chloroflexi bacterium]|nr:hypothetical protein [Chloroflexota bacterium]